MIEIKPIGTYFETNDGRFISNPCAPGKIAQEYVPLLDDLIQDLRMKTQNHLLAIFLRGSVPSGKAVAGFSDLDVVVLLHWNPKSRFIRWGKPLFEAEINEKYLPQYPFIKKIDIALAHHDPGFPGQNLAVKMILKTQSFCIWGRNVLNTIPPFRLGKVMMINHKWVSGQLQTWRDQEGKWENHTDEVAFLQETMKVVIRSGFELVMERSNTYTIDLYPCYTSFSAYYPEREPEMQQALLTYLNPDEAFETGSKLMETFVPWLLEEIQTVLVIKS